MYIKPIMSRVPIRRGGGGGGLTLVIILVLMMCVSVIVGAGGYVLFKPKKPAEKTKAEKTKAADDAQAAADALAADPDATPEEIAAAQAAAAAAAAAAADDTDADDTDADDTDADDTDTDAPPPDPINCVGTWSDWDGCSETCGGGIQAKEWTTTTEPLYGGTVCPSPSTETQACNEQACPIGDNGFDNETFYIKDVEGRYVGSDNWSNRNIMGLGGYNYPKTSYTLDGSLDETTIQSAGKYCLGWDNRINCSSDSAEDNGNFRLEKQSDGGFKIYNEGLGEYYIGAVKDENIFTQTLGRYAGQQTGEVLYPDYDGEELMNMTFFLERVP
jgi:hypothetical protein